MPDTSKVKKTAPKSEWVLKQIGRVTSGSQLAELKLFLDFLRSVFTGAEYPIDKLKAEKSHPLVSGDGKPHRRQESR